jgi:hypothetical protein
MTTKHKLTNKFYVRLTDQQSARIEEIRVRRGAYSTAEILREATVEFIENESDAISSRRHFSRSLQQNIARLEEQMQVIFAFQTMLMAGQFKEIHEMASDEGDEAVTVEQLLGQASRETTTQFFKVRALLGTLVQSKQKAEDAARKKAK